jgi:hypothetical protein
MLIGPQTDPNSGTFNEYFPWIKGELFLHGLPALPSASCLEKSAHLLCNSAVVSSEHVLIRLQAAECWQTGKL